jgi:hypothetical protein
MALVGSGMVGPGGSQFFDVVLQSGVTYQVYVKPIDNSVDFDLYIYDERGNVVARDTTTAPDAYCNITPLWTGPFRMEVKSERGFSPYNIVVQA